MRSVLHDFSLQELQYMRDHDKLSNREIADRCGISYNTVVRYLGRQPKDIPRYYIRSSSDNHTVPDRSKDPVEVAALICIDHPITMQGKVGIYTVHPSTSTVDIKIHDQVLKDISYDDLDTVVLELTRIAKRHKDVDPPELIAW